MSYINICYCADRVYESTVSDAIHYLRAFYRDPRELRIHVLTNDASLSIPGAEMIRMPWLYSIAQLRVMIPSVINNRCIYLDSDTIVNTCISRLWDIEHGRSTAMAICSNMPSCKVAGERYNINALKCLNRPFFNTGVIVFDCNRWRDDQLSERCLSKFSEYSDTTSYNNDEPGINMAIEDCYVLDPSWNYCPPVGSSYKKANIVHGKDSLHAGKPRHSLFKQ